MKVLRILSLLPAFLLLVQTGFSQADPNKILQDSKKKFSSLSDLTGKVSFTMTSPNLVTPVVLSGTFWMKKSKYKVVFPDRETYCNGTFVWDFKKKEKSTTKIDFDPEESLSADRVFKIYESMSKSKYEGLEGIRHKITVFTNKETDDVFKTIVWVNKTSNIIEKAALYARNGSIYTYDLSAIQTNTAISDVIFNYDETAAKKAGVYINDLTGD